MASRNNKALQIGGVVIIAASLVAVAYFANLARITTMSVHQPTRTTGVTEAIFDNGTTTTAATITDRPNTHVVTIPFGAWNHELLQEFFVPSSLSIPAGDTVAWLNNDTVGHTVTSVAFQSQLIWPAGSDEGNREFSHTFSRSGIFSYFCQIHPHMSGTIYADAGETQRRLVSTSHYPTANTIIEIPYDTAYHNRLTQGFFIPANAYVESNSRVTWVNNDYVAHTATATDGSFNTKVIDPRASKTLTIEHGPKRVPYYCQIHPWMQASLTVLPQ